ncbi:MAG TPA: murein biosynthesis integral membrane protein MurJ [Candidatus Woesebacteria bacterium]|nr:murein biosynthesis integral membrane protein MurJ [Candidatus Woesebacteria bacterium]HRT39884.1 murein biosynthesis integral membrane protein MurJ [Candidatus Woesebacteria bacterium]
MRWQDQLSKLFRTKQSSIMAASLVLAATFVISAILGFLRTRILYDHFFQTSILELDAFNAAFRLPDLIFKLLVTGAISASFIPVYTSYLYKNKALADKVASSTINLLFLAFMVISLIVFILANPFSRLIARGFSPYQISVMASLTRILLLAQIFFLFSNFLTSILQINQFFLVPALSPIVYNLVIISSIYLLGPKWGIYGVAWGTVAAACLHLLIQIPTLRRQGFHYQLIFNYHLTGVKEVIHLMIPQTFSIGVSEIESTVILSFASLLTAGSVSLLNLALQLMYLPSRILSTTVGQASLPILSRKVAEKNFGRFREIVFKTVIQSLFLALPIAVIVLVLRLDLVRLIFGSKKFPWEATKVTAATLGFLTPAIVCQALIQIIIRAFYALHNTKIPLISAIISLIVCIVSSFIFINSTSLGIAGLALGISLGDISQSLSLVVCFALKVKGFDWKEILNRFLLIIFSSLIGGLCCWGSMRLLDGYLFDTSRVIGVACVFIFSSLIGLASYFLTAFGLHLEEVADYKQYLLRLKHFIYRR